MWNQICPPLLSIAKNTQAATVSQKVPTTALTLNVTTSNPSNAVALGAVNLDVNHLCPRNALPIKDTPRPPIQGHLDFGKVCHVMAEVERETRPRLQPRDMGACPHMIHVVTVHNEVPRRGKPLSKVHLVLL